ncbi:MAG: S-layer homology domain-containing protein, partial [Clostridia bacterium]|nr:S-layer homology domain-containing protein [Clostridia bacterium]
MKKNLSVKTVITALALIILVLANTVFADGTLKFSDIEETAFYRDSVYKLVNNGVLNGYPDGTFKPFDTVTRAEMCKMINLTFGYTDTEGAAGFSDLVPNEWYIPYVLAGQKAGYVQGDDVGTFRPDDPITREEVCAILCRIIEPYDLQLPVTINDTVSEWAKDYVRIIVMNSIIPTESGNFRATENMKRYELAVAVAPYSNVKIDIAYCTIIFKNGGNVQTRTVEIGKTLSDFPKVTTNIPEGKKFVGWTLANPETDEELPLLNSRYVFNENKEIYAYAVFENADCNVKFMAGDILVKEEKVNYGASPTPPAYNPERVGKKFAGWAEQGTSEVVDLTTYKVTKDVVLTAVFVSDSSGSSGTS